MDFSKPGQPRLLLVDVNQPVENALSLCAAVLRRDGVGLEKHLAADLPRCRIDTSLIEQVMLNLLTNALEALRQAEAKKISVRTALEDGAVVVGSAILGRECRNGCRTRFLTRFIPLRTKEPV
jgi:C4-dicarboxylate-specific signal transduction histidine kinase